MIVLLHKIAPRYLAPKFLEDCGGDQYLSEPLIADYFPDLIHKVQDQEILPMLTQVHQREKQGADWGKFIYQETLIDSVLKSTAK